MGASSRDILKIFVTTGGVIGVLGTAVGLLLAFVVAVVLRDYFPFPLNPNVYQIDSLPINLQLSSFIYVGVAGLLITFLSTLYPSMKAARTMPAAGLRNE